MAKIELIGPPLSQFVSSHTSTTIVFRIPAHVQINYFSNLAHLMDIFETVNVKIDGRGAQVTTCTCKAGIDYQLQEGKSQKLIE